MKTPRPFSSDEHRDYRDKGKHGTALGHCKACGTLVKYGHKYCRECQELMPDAETDYDEED
jgi:uncharacterized OB-fold protein